MFGQYLQVTRYFSKQPQTFPLEVGSFQGMAGSWDSRHFLVESDLAEVREHRNPLAEIWKRQLVIFASLISWETDCFRPSFLDK